MAINISFASGKGGVGKTSLATNLAAFSARYGIKTLFVDCDVYTLGATIFFETGGLLERRTGDILTFQHILEGDVSLEAGDSINDPSRILNSITLSEEKAVHLSSNLDLIPAKGIDRGTEKYTGLSQEASNYDKILYPLMKKWDADYDLVIYDLNAGFYALQHLIIGNCQKIILVRENNKLSKNTSQEVYEKIKRQFAGREFYDCTNKQSSKEAWPKPETYEKRCLGFSRTEDIISQLEEGNILAEKNTVPYQELAKLAKFLLPEFKDNWESYNNFVKRAEQDEKSRERRAQIREECNRIKYYWQLWNYKVLLIALGVLIVGLFAYGSSKKDVYVPSVIIIGIFLAIGLILIIFITSSLILYRFNKTLLDDDDSLCVGGFWKFIGFCRK